MRVRTTTNGGLYISCTLTDKTGKLNARMWNASEAIYRAIPADGFIQVRGRTENYRGNLQFINEAVKPIPAESVDLTDFMPAAEGDPEEMWSDLLEILRGVKNPYRVVPLAQRRHPRPPRNRRDVVPSTMR